MSFLTEGANKKMSDGTTLQCVVMQPVLMDSKATCTLEPPVAPFTLHGTSLLFSWFLPLPMAFVPLQITAPVEIPSALLTYHPLLYRGYPTGPAS